jgi:NAD(P)-dependent dehydrogenase (short-subunit alcohol dehydrogenase family)
MGVLVTGSTRGIGRATAELFAAHGAHVIVHGLEDDGETVEGIRSAGGKADFVAADLSEESAAERIVDFAMGHAGRLDVLVNNAGANVFGGVLDTDVATWNRCLDLDLRAVWLCSRAAARVMDGGAIVNVASNHAFATLPGVFPYNVAKAAVLALTQSLAIELAPIRVNAVCPGYIDTPINDTYFGGFADPAAERARVEALHPLRRIGRPEEVARAIRFLAHDGFTTGTTLTIDGGRSALMQDPPGGETHGK